MKVRPQAIFSFVFLIFFIVFVYQAQDWRLQARLYPWAIGIPMIILAIIQFILDLKGVERKQKDEAPVMDYQFSQTVEPKLVMGIPSHHRFPPNGTPKPRCTPDAGASLM